MKNPQELATKVFVTASLLFGITGILIVLTSSVDGDGYTWLPRVLGVLAFTVLSSFGVSVGLKYLSK